MLILLDSDPFLAQSSDPAGYCAAAADVYDQQLDAQDWQLHLPAAHMLRRLLSPRGVTARVIEERLPLWRQASLERLANQQLAPIDRQPLDELTALNQAIIPLTGMLAPIARQRLLMSNFNHWQPPITGDDIDERDLFAGLARMQASTSDQLFPANATIMVSAWPGDLGAAENDGLRTIALSGEQPNWEFRSAEVVVPTLERAVGVIRRWSHEERMAAAY